MFLKTKFKTRLIFSVLMLGATALTLTTSTFAWFATNRNAWFDEIELQIGNADSLLVSVDGSSYRSSIPSDMLKRAVVAKKLGIDYNDSRLDEETYLKSEWAKVSLEPITTYDLDTFNGIDNKHVLTEDENGKELEEKTFILHEIEEKTSYLYLEFDVWFKMEASKNASKTYDLKLVNDEYIESENNSGNTVQASYITGNETNILLYNDLNAKGTEYKSGDFITVNTQDAMRVGIKRINEDTNEVEDRYIFEPYEGLGSYALEEYINTTDEAYSKYDPNKNAMFTYFNNVNEAKLKPLSNSDFDYTTNVFRNGLKDDISLGEIAPNQSSTDYNELKLTISVWLEGFDADYIIGIKNNSLKMYLNFYAEEKDSNE